MKEFITTLPYYNFVRDKTKTNVRPSQRYSYADLIYALVGEIDDCHVNPKYSSDPINNKEKQ